jgi:AmmeMemoRadiSam system protein A
VNADQGGALLRLARGAIEASFENRRIAVPPDIWLQEPGAAFVTLRQRADRALRGCIGSIEALGPLGDAVVTAALGAAFRDPRFSPLARVELPLVLLDVSVLSPMMPLPVADEADAVAQLDRARPGVLLTYGRRRGVFLPQVWDTLGDAGEFLRHLKRKAGLPVGFWSQEVAIEVFTCEEFIEPGGRSAREEAS